MIIAAFVLIPIVFLTSPSPASPERAVYFLDGFPDDGPLGPPREPSWTMLVGNWEAIGGEARPLEFDSQMVADTLFPPPGCEGTVRGMNQASLVTTLCLSARSAAASGHGLDLTLALSRTSFLPGEHVFVTVALSNSSAQPLNCVYPMNPGQGFLKLEIRDQETGQMISKNCHAPSYICPVPGCELAPGAEHVEVIAVTQCYGIRGLDAPKLPPPLLPHAGALPEGVYRMSAVYATPSCSETESYVLASNSVDFRVVSPAEIPKTSIWWNLAASFHTNDSVYRDKLSSLVEEHIDEPFVASLYLESSFFHQSATRRESSLRIVKLMITRIATSLVI